MLHRLAKESTMFRRAYCQYPVCGPTRASFLSGLYPERTGVFDTRIMLEAMPWPAWAWGRLLPLTSYLQLQIEQTARGSSVAASLPQLGALVAVALTGGAVALALVRRRASQPESWGHR